MSFDDQNWNKSTFGKFVDQKIGFFKFPNTLVILGEWNAHDENMKVFPAIGETFWFSIIAPQKPDLEENYIGLYYIRINNEEHKELGVQIFKNNARAFYARCYEGLEATESYRKKVE